MAEIQSAIVTHYRDCYAMVTGRHEWPVTRQNCLFWKSVDGYGGWVALLDMWQFGALVEQFGIEDDDQGFWKRYSFFGLTVTIYYDIDLSILSVKTEDFRNT